MTGNTMFYNKFFDKIDSFPHCFKPDIRMGKLLAAIGKFFCFVQVNQSTVGIKERFGKFEEVLKPGCHFMPWIIGNRVTGQLTLRLRQLDVRCETKTKVSNF
jgi:regulator of protease activity HflC (stomatin/prohibitin superfamily)